jgi:hypothetical protein
MSTAVHATDVATIDNQLNQMILQGQILDAFEKFYAEDVVMQENLTEPKVGKTVNRKAEQEFIGSIEQFHGAALLGSAVNGERSYSEWEFDATYKGGHRVKMTQVAVRQWKNGLVAHERFYYSK